MIALWKSRLHRRLIVLFCGGVLATFAYGVMLERSLICGIEFEAPGMAERIEELRAAQ